MKAKLINILNQCTHNKTIADFNIIDQLVTLIVDDRTDDISIKHNGDSVYISLWYDRVKLFSIMFMNDNRLLCSLPDDICKTYFIDNDSYNIQYDDIKALLSYK